MNRPVNKNEPPPIAERTYGPATESRIRNDIGRIRAMADRLDMSGTDPEFVMPTKQMRDIADCVEALLAEIERLRVALVSEHNLNWTGSLCDRLNSIVREHSDCEPQCTDGPSGSDLARRIHAYVGGLRADRDRLAAHLRETLAALETATAERDKLAKKLQCGCCVVDGQIVLCVRCGQFRGSAAEPDPVAEVRDADLRCLRDEIERWRAEIASHAPDGRNYTNGQYVELEADRDRLAAELQLHNPGSPKGYYARYMAYKDELTLLRSTANRLGWRLHERRVRAKADRDRIEVLSRANRLLKKAAEDLLFAYQNKDGEFPHQFETDAVAKAKEALASIHDPAIASDKAVSAQ